MTCRAVLRRCFPGPASAGSYRLSWLRDDLVAGLVLTALLIPAGLGYAEVAGLPPVTGLYATIAPLLVYALIGPSRVLILGPDSSLAPIIAAAVVPMAVAGPDRVALAGVLALEVGAVLLVAAVLHLGALTRLLAKPIRIGYLNGVALVVVVGQLPGLFGLDVGGDSLSGQLTAAVRGIVDGDAVPRAAVLGLGSLALILACRAVSRRIPGVLVAVVVATVTVAVCGWRGDVPVVGAMPRGLPEISFGSVSPEEAFALLVPATGIALIAFADTGVLSSAFAARDGRHVDSNHEMAALGGANIAAGLFGGFPVSASSSRTPVAAEAGARTQLTAVIGALLVLTALLLIPGITTDLPSAALSAVVITAALSLVDVSAVVSLFTIDRVEGAICLAATAGVAVLGVLEGIAVAVVLALVTFINAFSRPYRTQLGKVPGLPGYHDMTRYPQAEPVTGTVLLRFDAPLFFGNGAAFDEWARGTVDSALAQGRDIHTVVLASEPVTRLDSSAIDELVEFDDYLHSRGITLYFAEMKDPVREQLGRYWLRIGQRPRFPADRFAPTLETIVGRLEDTGDDPPPPGGNDGIPPSGTALQ